MINIFVTYRCNLACSYCFARELRGEFPRDMAEERFDALLAWMVRAGVPVAAFIGGEPTLHPRLVEMVERTTDAGVAAVLFTNGLFPQDMAARLAGRVSNFVVNYNAPEVYAPAQWALLHENLDRLRELSARITFSKNFSPRHADYGYLLEGIDRYGVTAVRYDISRPSGGGGNDHCTFDGTRAMMAHVVGFVKGCERRGVRTGLDCSVRLCDLRDDDRRYLERVSTKFTGVCHPSIDVHPDLSASYCLPLCGLRVPDVTRFADQDALRWHFAQAARPLRQENVSAACLDCKDFMRRCQGGCLALRQGTPHGQGGCEQAKERAAGQADGQAEGRAMDARATEIPSECS